MGLNLCKGYVTVARQPVICTRFLFNPLWLPGGSGKETANSLDWFKNRNKDKQVSMSARFD